jgi:hypothetical protein
MLHQVHGRPQLHLPQAQDVGPQVPNGVITVGPTYRHAYECDVECMEIAEALTESEALIANMESLPKEAPDTKRHAGNFEPAEAVKSVPLDPSNDTSKQIRIGSELDPK